MDSVALDALQTEVDFYRQNQTEVEEEIRALIADNQNLSKHIAMMLKEKLESERLGQTCSNEQTKQLEDLKQQIIILTEERDSLQVLWKTAQATIEALDTELKTYQSCGDGGAQNMCEENKNLELKLEAAITDYVDLETKYKELYKHHIDLKKEVKNKQNEIECYKERGKELEDKWNKTNENLNQLITNSALEKKNYENIKYQLTLCQQEFAESVKKEAEAKSKVAEALQLYDTVSAQKEDACKTIQELTEQLSQHKRMLSNVRSDIEVSCKREIDELKEKYNEKVADMLEHIRTLDSELVEKGLLLNKAIRENKILRETNDNYLQEQKQNTKAVHPKLALAEQRLEAMFQELVSSERRNIQLVCEKQCLSIDIQRIQDIHMREIKRRDWEEQLLKTQCKELKAQVEHLQSSLEETHGMVNRLQKILSSRADLSQKMVSSKEEELFELNKQLENQIELSKKWKISYLEMVEKLKKRLTELQKENKELRAKLSLDVSTPNDDSTNS